MSRLYLIILFFLLLVNFGQAQYYSTGQDRATIEWQQIETDKFQLVYPNYFEEQAQRLANLLTVLYECNVESMEVKPKKVSILLHTESTKSNGYVVWAPRRSEMYSTAPDVGMGGDWLTHLATHEYRHIVQMDKMNETLPKLLTSIFGEQILPFVLAYKVPMWFLEGDAVVAETLMSSVGRGRSPDFLQTLKAELVEHKKWYNYDKGNLGSYKDFVPNRYDLGYFMVANTRKNYGSDVWNNALAEAGKKAFPWQNFLKKGITNEKRQKVFKKINAELANSPKLRAEFQQKWRKNKHRNPMLTLYNDNLLELQMRWKQEVALRDTTDYQSVSPSVSSYTNYQYPQVFANGSVVAYKIGFDCSGEIVQIKNGKERTLCITGFLTSALQHTDKFLYWTESVPDMRWQERSKYALCLFDLRTKKLTRTVFHRSLRMLTMSVDSKYFAVVQRQPNDENKLLVFDRKTGKKRCEINTQDKMLFNPQFISNTKVACIFKKAGAGVLLLDLETKKQKIIVAERNALLKDLSYNKDDLYFTASYSGQNEIYRYDLNTRSLSQLTASRYGASQPTVSATALCYANYTAMGNKIVATPKSQIVKKQVIPTDWNDDLLLNAIKKQESCEGKLVVKNQKFHSKPYEKWKNLFNFHSQSPFAISEIKHKDYDFGISTTSQNLLSTMFVNLGIRRKNAYKYGQIYANMVYKGWYPIMATEVSLGKQERRLLTLLKQNSLTDTAIIKEKKQRLEWKTRVSLPLNLSRGKYIRNLALNTSLELSKDMHIRQSYLSGTLPNSSFQQGDAVDLGFAKTNALLKYDLVFSNLQKKAYRDLYSPFGQQLFLTYKHTPFARRHLFLYAIEGVLYLPLPIAHNGLRLYSGYNFQSEVNSFLQTEIAHPRGTVAVLAKQKYTLMSDYKFPLAYPDWNLGRVLYVKRLTGGIFYDFGSSKTDVYIKNVHSLGVECNADIHCLQMPIPMGVGVQIGWESERRNPYFAFLFSWGF
ncbi:MAG: hypothetical protein KGV44_09210 [Flavobacteriaceae bacterium]|nr:hypothetical protein [Flavobacteriaceae bacterium]